MPVLMAFYNHGNILMEVSEEQLLSSWKEFFSTGTNWKDLDKNMTIQKYNSISDKEHLKKILSMPVHFLLESGKGFFVKKDGAAIGLREELRPLIDNPVMVCQMKDVIDYRAMENREDVAVARATAGMIMMANSKEGGQSETI